MKHRIRLDTMNDIRKFVEVASRIDEQVFLEDGNGMRTSAKSILGSLYAMEWSEIYVYCQRDISGSILPWII